ncbi:MAG: cytochrome c biogenesis protein CcsA [Woeseia sp.]
MFQITLLFLYIIAGLSFVISRLPRFSQHALILVSIAWVSAIAGIFGHALSLRQLILQPEGIYLSLGNTASFIGLLLGLTAAVIAIEKVLRGLSAGLLLLAAATAGLTGWSAAPPSVTALTWQVELHILISVLAYGLLSVGAIVAIYALVQDARLRSGRLSSVNRLFAPLETNERLLYGIATGGFVALLLAVFSGFIFIEDLFAQHLVHKTVLSLLALMLFGILLCGRHFGGWRGRRAISLYLWGFLVLGIAYFGSRYVLEQILGRSWT